MENTHKKRQFTEAQLARKRHVDRMNNMAKRAEQKQVENIGSQVTVLQEAVQGLAEQVGNFNQLLSVQSPREKHSLSKPSLYDPDNVPVDCRCGMDHLTRDECLEYLTFCIIFNAHQTLKKNVTDSGPLPRTPSILHIFHPVFTGNPITHMLGLVFGRIRPANTPTYFAVYLVMYRFLRWRLYPHEDIVGDLPVWALPTEMQRTVPHPISIDFLPWPRLRDHMIGLAQSPERDPRHSVILYIQSIRFNWPENRNFIQISPSGELQITEEFEVETYSYNRWQLSQEWASMFPHLRGLVNVEGDVDERSLLEN